MVNTQSMSLERLKELVNSKKPKIKKIPIGIQVTQEEYMILKEIAKRLKITPSTIVKLLTVDFLEKYTGV